MQQEALQSHFKRGVATLCILSLLSEREMYGYEIAQALETISGGGVILPEGTLYPILYRLEDDGYLDAKRIRVGKRMTRVYYRISENGQEYYAALLEDYNSIHTGVQLILSRSNEENEK